MRTSRGLSAISIVFLFITVLSIALEAGVFLVRRSRETDPEKLEVAVSECGSYEFRPTGEGNEFEALANDSFFDYTFSGFGAADSVTVHMKRHPDDPTETVMYASGLLDGVEGEFVFALKQVAEDRFTAELRMDRLDGVRIYPTEKVHVCLTFDGFTVNEEVRRTAYSFGEMFLFWMLTAFILYIVVVIRAAKNGTQSLSPWLGAALGGSAFASFAGLMASRMFTAAADVGDALAICAGVMALLGVAGIHLAYVIKSLPVKAAVMAAALALLFTFASAPLQAPDEYTHFMRTWTVSKGDLTFNNDYRFPQDVYLLDDLFAGEFHNNLIKTGKGNAFTAILEYRDRVNGEIGDVKTYETHIQILLPYLLPGAAMAVGRFLGMKALGLMYLGRLANAAMFVWAVWRAMHKAKRYRFAVMIAAFWPLTVFMCASLSYDALYLSAFLIFISSVLGEVRTKRETAEAVLSFGIMVAIKPTSAVLALLFLLLPKEERKPKLWGGALLCGAALYFAVLGYAALAAKGMAPESVLPGVDVTAQIKYILSNPFRYLLIMLVDGYQNGFYAGRAGLFGWLDVPTVMTPFLSLLGFLAASILGTKEAQRSRGKWDNLWFGLLTVLFYGITITGFYCQCSTLGSSSVLGVQARYLIPVLPCTAALTANGSNLLRITVGEEEDYCGRLALWICSGVTLIAAGELFLNYFLM